MFRLPGASRVRSASPPRAALIGQRPPTFLPAPPAPSSILCDTGRGASRWSSPSPRRTAQVSAVAQLRPDGPAVCGQLCGDVTLVWDEPLCSADVVRTGATDVDGFWGDACMALQAGDEVKCREVVEVRPPLTYDSEHIGAGRLQLTWAHHAGARVMPTGLFHDTVLATPCFPTDANPGQFRCEASGGIWPSVITLP